MGMDINHRQTRDSRDAGKSKKVKIASKRGEEWSGVESRLSPRVKFVSLFDSVQHTVEEPLIVLYLAE